MYYLLLVALCVALMQSLIAQNSNPVIGARANGTGYTSSCSDDGWSVLNNPGGLASIKELQAGLGYELVSGFPAYNRMAAFVVVPLSTGSVGAGILRFGDELYSEHVITAGYGNRFGLASLGASLRYIQYRTEGFGGKSLFSFSAGGIAEITPWLSVGAQIVNGIQPELAEGERIPTLLLAGVALKPSTKVTALFEVEKDIGFSPLIKAGLEYAINTRFTTRTGININPVAGFGGFAFSRQRLQLDYAFSWFTSWTSIHQVSLVYRLRQKK